MVSERASTTERGYGTKHQRERKRWQERLDGGRVVQCTCYGSCGRHERQCPTVIDHDTPSDQWDLAHNPGQQGYAGPWCRPCNRADGAIRSNQPRLIVREW